MNDDSFVIFFGNERKQTFRIDRRSVGLTQMKDIKPFIKQSGQNLVFFHKIRGSRYQY